MNPQTIFEKDNFTCQKCGFHDEKGKELEVHPFGKNNFVTLCLICHKHAPESEKEFKKYIKEKIDSKILETFRKSEQSISKKTKQGMTNSFKTGKHISKAPRGYKLVNKELIVNEKQAEEVRQIFKEFAETNISLTQLSKKHNLTTPGLIKLLKNTTYIGKVKFAEQESQGKHPAIIDGELFEKVRGKLN